MRAMSGDSAGRPRPVRGFTLIELLVVVAIIALLISILLPSLGNARKQARCIVCGTNLGTVGKAFQFYLAENRTVYPPSYIYPSTADGAYDLQNQPPDHPYGYMHWSYYLFQNGEIKDEAFRCPEMGHGGAPRTNPGPEGSNWEPGQVDQNGQTASSGTSLVDKQASRMAFTANGAIIPRNKFTQGLTSEAGDEGARLNVFVNETRIADPRAVILATEFSSNYRLLSVERGGGNYLVKSHRPVNAFYSFSTGCNEYADAGGDDSPFVCPDPEDEHFSEHSLKPLSELENAVDVISGSLDCIEVNAVGRHHPGGDKFGGTTSFLYVDGHVERKPIRRTLQGREWGSEFYSLDTSSDNRIRFYGESTP